MTYTGDTIDTITVRLPRDIVEAIRKLSDQHDRTLSAELRVALKQYLQEQNL